VGLEVGWYLRLAKADRIEALVSPSGADQVRNAMYIHTDWVLETEEVGDHVRALMTRKKPRYDKEEA